MPHCNITMFSLPLLALSMSGCGKVESSLPVSPVVSQCPTFPSPPPELIQRPMILDFLPAS